MVLLARQGKLAYLRAFGFQEREQQRAMQPDSIFRIASMTKPVVSVAAMTLVEAGTLELERPVAFYLPEFAEAMVGVEALDGAGKPTLTLEPPARPMRVHDLLRHTSGLTYGAFGKSLVKQTYNSAGLYNPEQSLAEMVGKLAKLPLAHQPGTMWDYSMSVDVLGRVIEVVSAQPLDRFVASRVTEPLGMSDTAFLLPEEKASRLAQPQPDKTTGQRPAMSDPTKPRWFSGGGGIVSTAPDYARFCQMLLNRGELDGMRLLAPKTVALMTADALPPGLPRESEIAALMTDLAPTPEMGQGFGLGFAVRVAPGLNPLPGSVGLFYWAGITGSYFWVDPQEELFAVLMVQLPVRQIDHYRRLVQTLTYQALLS